MTTEAVKLEPGYWTAIDSFSERTVGMIPIRLSETPQGDFRWESEGFAFFRDDGESQHRCYRARHPFRPFGEPDPEAARISALEAENAALKAELVERQADLTFFAGIIRRGSFRVMELERAIREHRELCQGHKSYTNGINSRLWSVLDTPVGNAVADDHAKAMHAEMEGRAE